MPQYALRTVRFPVNNRCHNFPLWTPTQLVASLCGLKFPYRRRTPNRLAKRQVLNFFDKEVSMRRSYFHLRGDDELIPDEEGMDLPDISAVRRSIHPDRFHSPLRLLPKPRQFLIEPTLARSGLLLAGGCIPICN